jgi:hypothetical protein
MLRAWNWCRFLVLGYDYYYRNKKPFFLLYTISCLFFCTHHYVVYIYIYIYIYIQYDVFFFYTQYDVFFFIHNKMSFFFIHNMISFFFLIKKIFIHYIMSFFVVVMGIWGAKKKKKRI